MKVGVIAAVLVLAGVIATARERTKSLEVVCSAGSGARVKLWLGETNVFVARPKADGLDALFAPRPWLTTTRWTFDRIARANGTALAIDRGVSIVRRGEVIPFELWGEPPSTFTCPNDVLGVFRPGRYRLVARSEGYAPVQIRVDVAAFELHDVNAELTSDGYDASMTFRVTDPSERRRVLPIEVRITDSKGLVVDYLKRAALRHESAHGTFISKRVHISSRVKYANRARWDERDMKKRPDGRVQILKVSPGDVLRITLDGTTFTFPMPLVVATQIVGGSAGGK